MNKKNILSFLTALFIMNNNTSLSDIKGYFKKYQEGTVYIGSKEYLQSINNVGINDILVLDARDEKDPDMKVYSSYLINDFNIQEEILKILIEYEEENPSLWNRSIESMQREWCAHNLMALFSYKKESTMDVDFNNADEEKYSVKYIKRKILK